MRQNQQWGSKTAKQGFANEKMVVDSFKNWQHDADAQAWLGIMGYDITTIEYVVAEIISKQKADIVVEIKIKLKTALSSENIQVKLISGGNFNQIDKRWLSTYVKMWHMPVSVKSILSRFCG